MNIVAIYAGMEEMALLSLLLKVLYEKFPKIACIVVQPKSDLTDETQLYNDIAAATFFQVLSPSLNKTIEAGGLYIIPAQKQFLLQHASFVSFNFWNDRMEGYINTFCHYLATNNDHQVAFIALQSMSWQSFDKEKSILEANGVFFAIVDTINQGAIEKVCLKLEEKWLQAEKVLGDNMTKKLQENVKFGFSDYLQHVALSILCLDLNFNIRKYTTSLLHYVPIDTSFIGKSVKNLNLPDVFAFLPDIAKNVLDTQMCSIQNLVYLPSGERCMVDVYPTYEHGSNLLKGVIIILSDQTENIRTKEQLEGMRLNIEEQGRAYWQAKAQWLEENVKNTLVVKQLDRQTELFYSILACMTEGIIALDSQDRISLINKSAMDILEIEGRTDQDFKKWIEQQDFYYNNVYLYLNKNPFLQLPHKDETISIELEVRNKKSNQSRFLSVNMQSLPRGINEDEGKGRLIVIRDISKRKKAEQKERAIIEAVPDMMFTMNKQGVFLDVYPDKNSILNLSTFLVGNTIDDTYGEIAEFVHEAIECVLNTQKLQTVEFKSLNKDKDRFDLNELRFSYISQEHVLGLVRDITDIVEGKHTIEQGAKHYRELLDNVPIPVILLNQAGDIIHHNSIMLDILGVKKGTDFIGKNVFEFVATNITRARNGLANLFREKVSKKINKFELLMNDKNFYVYITGELINYENQRIAQISILKTIEKDMPKTATPNTKNNLGNAFKGVIVFEWPSFKIHSHSKKLNNTLSNLNTANLIEVFKGWRSTENINGSSDLSNQLPQILEEIEKKGMHVFSCLFDKDNTDIEINITAAIVFKQNDTRLFSFSIVSA